MRRLYYGGNAEGVTATLKALTVLLTQALIVMSVILIGIGFWIGVL